MPNYRISALDIVASYDRIDETLPMRPTPQDISMAVADEVSASIDFPAAFAALSADSYSADSAKLATPAAQADVLNELQSRAGALLIDLAAAATYRKTSGGSHETIFFLMRSVDGTMQPWRFHLLVKNQFVDGVVCVSLQLSQVVDSSVAEAGSTGVVKAASATAIPVGDRAAKPTVDEHAHGAVRARSG